MALTKPIWIRPNLVSKKRGNRIERERREKERGRRRGRGREEEEKKRKRKFKQSKRYGTNLGIDHMELYGIQEKFRSSKPRVC